MITENPKPWTQIVLTQNDGRVETINPQGEIKIISGLEQKKKLPEGILDSLLPVFQKAFLAFPNVLSPDENFWTTLEERAKYTPEKAAITARKIGYSTEDLAHLLFSRMAEIAGNWNPKREGVNDEFLDALQHSIGELYSSTLQSTPRKVR